MPFVLPLIMTVPLGVLFGKVYELWNFSGLSGQKALETAVLISLAVAGVYALYFLITYCIACNHVICHGDEEKKNLIFLLTLPLRGAYKILLE